MSTQIQRRRGTTAEHGTFTGVEGELTVDTTKDTVVVHDGSQIGGFPLLREDGSNSALALGSQGSPSLKFTGDTNTGIYSPGADQVAISTGGTGRLFVDASGQVGVGATPSGPFDVYGGTWKRLLVTFPDTYTTKLALSTGGYLQSGVGDDAVKLYNTANGPTIFGTNNNPRLYITGTGELKHIGGGTEGSPAVYFAGSAPSNSLYVQATTGRVGVGTSSFPGSGKLQVVGANATTSIGGTECVTLVDGDANNEFNILSFATSAGGTIARIGAKATTTGAYPSSVGALHFAVQNGASTNTAMVIDATGNVGIGTTSPGTTAGGVDISSGGIGAIIGADSNATTRTNSTSKVWRIGSYHYTNSEEPVCVAFGQNLNNDNELNFGGGTSALNAATYIRFFTAANNTTTSGTERARIDSSGRLLVGATLARTNLNNVGQSAKFQLEGTSNSTNRALIVSNYSTGVDAVPAGLYLARAGSTAVGSVAVVDADNQLGEVVFLGSDGTDFVQAALIKCEVDGTPGADDMPGRLVFSTNAGSPATSPTERMRISSDGQLRFGKTVSTIGTDGTLLSNDGRFYCTIPDSTAYHLYSSAASAYRFYVAETGTINATVTTISAISDQRLKENIRDLDTGLTEILALQPRRFDWKEGKGRNIQGDQGFIAQEFEQVFPEMIGEWLDPAPEGEEPYKSVRADLIPVLVKAIQEQQAIINGLEARLAALEAQ